MLFAKIFMAALLCIPLVVLTYWVLSKLVEELDNTHNEARAPRIENDRVSTVSRRGHVSTRTGAGESAGFRSFEAYDYSGRPSKYDEYGRYAGHSDYGRYESRYEPTRHNRKGKRKK